LRETTARRPRGATGAEGLLFCAKVDDINAATVDLATHRIDWRALQESAIDASKPERLESLFLFVLSAMQDAKAKPNGDERIDDQT